jgi:mRNA interferase MazF
MKRGDVVTVAVSGDYGKPRPAVIVQTNALPEDHGSIVVCQMTSNIETSKHFRVLVEPTAENGLRIQSQIMADKPAAVRCDRIGRRIGRLAAADVARLNVALTFVMGLAD